MTILHLLATATAMLFLYWLFTLPRGRRLVIKEEYHIPAEQNELEEYRSTYVLLPAFVSAFTMTIVASFMEWGVHPAIAIFFSAITLVAALQGWTSFMVERFRPSDEYLALCEVANMEKIGRSRVFLRLYKKYNLESFRKYKKWFENPWFVRHVGHCLETSIDRVTEKVDSSDLHKEVKDSLAAIRGLLLNDIRLSWGG